MVLDQVSPDLLSIVLPTVLGVLLVLAMIAVVFWLGSGTQQSYEEAKAQATRKAKEVLKEREKEQMSPKAKKPRRTYRKKKPEELQEDAEVVPRKGILKTPPVVGVVETSAIERSPPLHKVEFKLDTTPPKSEGKAVRNSPPTPHPNKDPSPLPQSIERTPQPIFEEPEPDDHEEVSGPMVVPEEETRKAPRAKTIPTPVSSPPSTAPVIVTGKSAGGMQRKSKAKGKQMAAETGTTGVSASRITEILGASSLTDEEIQQLIELLLEKSNANSEWEAANFKAESNKSLKKHNQELASRLEEAQRTVVAHSSKIKELRREIQVEKNKYQTTETSFQSKFNQQGNEISIYKTRALGLEEEVKQLKAMNEQHIQKLRTEETGLLVSHLQQQLSTANESNKALKRQLESGGAGMPEKLAEKETLLEQRNHDMEKMQVTLQYSQVEVKRLTSELSDMKDERSSLKQKVDSLEAAQKQLVAKTQQASLEKEDSLAQIEMLRGTMEKAKSENITQVKTELQAQYSKEIEGLRQTIAQSEGLRAEVDRLRETVAKLEGENKQLIPQMQKNSSLEQQVAALTQQLEAEQASKKDLQHELEVQLQTTPNGPVQPLSNGDNDQEPPQKVDQSLLSEKQAQLEKLTESKMELEGEVTVLGKKLDELKTKNKELSNDLWQVKNEVAVVEKVWEKKLKQSQQQAEERIKSAKVEFFAEFQQGCRSLLQLLPEISVDEESDEWLEEFEAKARDRIEAIKEENENLKERVTHLEIRNEESTEEVKRFRQPLEDTMEILKKLQSEVDSTNAQHQLVMEEKETALERERSTNKDLQEQLCKEKMAVAQVQEKLEKEKKALAKLKEELEDAKKEGSEAEEEMARLGQLEQRLQDMELGRKNMEKEVGDLRNELRQKEEEREELEKRVASERSLKEEASVEHFKLLSDLTETKAELKKKSDLFELMKQSNRELNARLSVLEPSSPKDSEV